MVAPSVQTQEKQPVQVVVQPPSSPEPTKPQPKWSSKDLVVASVGFLCCNLIGLPALILAVFSYVDHSNKRYDESSAKRWRARRLGICAIVVGTLIVLGFVAWHFCPYRRSNFTSDAIQERRPWAENMKEGFGEMDGQPGDVDRRHRKPCPRPRPGPHPRPRPGPGPHPRPHPGPPPAQTLGEEVMEKIHEQREEIMKTHPDNDDK